MAWFNDVMVIEHSARCVSSTRRRAKGGDGGDGGETWKERDEDLRKQLISSVEALLTFKKYPIPNATALSKRLKVGAFSSYLRH